MTALPERTREYHGAVFDSTYWDHFRPRDGDIVISTSMKAGTTWMQRICASLVFQQAELDRPMDAISPWIDMRVALPEFTMPLLESQTHRRIVKTHLPLDALPYFENLSYIVVSRDARDVFMSTVNHYRNLNQRIYDEINTRDGAELLAYRDSKGYEMADAEREAWSRVRRWEGESIPRLDDIDILDCWRNWATRSVYPWESDGYPAWSHFYHLASWWPHRRLPNIMFVHYADLLADLDGQMRRISEWLDIPIDTAVWPSLVEAATFSRMKKDFQKTTPVITQGIWKDPEKFFHKGTSNQWRDVLGDEELELYEAAVNRSLDTAARRWMEEGSLAFADPRVI